MERDARAKRAKPPPGARTRASRAHPAPPPSLSARPGFPGPGSGGPPGSPLFAWGEGNLSPLRTRRFKAAPSSLLLSDGGPPRCSPPPPRKALGNPHPHPRERPRGAGGGQKGEPGTVPKPSREPRVEVKVGDRGLQSPPAPVQRGGTKGREEKDMPVCFRPQTSGPAPRAATTACREAEGAKGARAASPRRPWPGLGPRRHLPRPRLAH